MKYTQENIARSQKERELSEKLRGEIDTCLRACANAMWSQFNGVNNAFGTRIQETNDAKNKLQAHLSRVNKVYNTNTVRKDIQDNGSHREVIILEYHYVIFRPKLLKKVKKVKNKRNVTKLF